MRPSLPPVVPANARFTFAESPFRVKGVLYIGTQTYFERNVPGGLGTLLEAIEDDTLRDFIGQKFLASSRYDVMLVPALIAREADAVGQPLDVYLRARTEWQARQDINGVYRMLLRLVSPDAVAKRLPRLLVQMFDFPEVDVVALDGGTRLATFHHIPKPLEHWLRIAFEVYAQTAITLAGGHDVDINFDQSTDEDLKAGLRMRALRMHVSWS